MLLRLLVLLHAVEDVVAIKAFEEFVAHFVALCSCCSVGSNVAAVVGGLGVCWILFIGGEAKPAHVGRWWVGRGRRGLWRRLWFPRLLMLRRSLSQNRLIA